MTRLNIEISVFISIDSYITPLYPLLWPTYNHNQDSWPTYLFRSGYTHNTRIQCSILYKTPCTFATSQCGTKATHTGAIYTILEQHRLPLFSEIVGYGVLQYEMILVSI